MESVLALFRQQVKTPDVMAEIKRCYTTDWAEEEVQDLFVRDVLQNPSSQRYPPTLKYLWLLCKLYVKEVERQYMAVSDALIEACLDACPKEAGGSDADKLLGSARGLEYSYKVYDIEGAVFGIKVWPEFSQVGLALWPAGFAIADWVLQHRDALKGSSIVELGSGVGLTGIVAAEVCSDTRRIVMTDYLPTVNANARENIAGAGFADRVSVDELDWVAVQNREEKALSLIKDYDTTCLLAADVVYDISVVPALSDTLRAFMEHSPNLQHIVFAVTKRNEATFQYLLEQLLRNGLHLEATEYPSSSGAFVYDGSLITLYSLSIETTNQ